ncbi:MAG TPA: sigma-54 dependent transcriptional regulator [Bacteroidota bacterium]|nr:sigma-54 dependent transcriptional regulator [Bacteroidota bacterium]
MGKHSILIVDDEKSIRDTLRMTLEYEGYAVSEAESGQQALDTVRRHAPDAILLDVKMSGMDGLETLEHLRREAPGVPVVLLTGHGSIETAVEATKKGAFDFLSKPPDREKILITLRNAITQTALLAENRSMRERLEAADMMIGNSPAMRELHERIARVAPTEAFVLITGENGSGKELVAKAIHRMSTRAHKDMVEVNCAAIPHELIESELFGHEKGSFTGAMQQRIGKFEQADGGILFLDEIGDMSPSAQAKVLRVLEEGTFERVGGGKRITVSVRVIAATNKDLALEIREGRFREDLFHRLNVIPIVVPPLRERRDDIPALVRYFLEQSCAKNKLPPRGIDEAALRRLCDLPWTGNVRELRNAVERLVIMVSDTITATDVARYVLGAAAPQEEGLSMEGTFQDYKDRMERRFIVHRLEKNEWNISKTAEELDIQRSHLYSKMKKYAINNPAGVGDR